MKVENKNQIATNQSSDKRNVLYSRKVFLSQTCSRMSPDTSACVLCAGQMTDTYQMLGCRHEVMQLCHYGWCSPHDEDLCCLLQNKHQSISHLNQHVLFKGLTLWPAGQRCSQKLMRQCSCQQVTNFQHFVKCSASKNQFFNKTSWLTTS